LISNDSTISARPCYALPYERHVRDHARPACFTVSPSVHLPTLGKRPMARFPSTIHEPSVVKER
jgi:hypothetical protein